MINLLCAFLSRDHPIRLNVEFRLDLQWWIEFLDDWNGTSFILLPGLMPVSDLCVTSDAAGAIGYGALYHQQWFSHKWMPSQMPMSIAYKEFFPVVIGAHLWGDQWANRRVCFRLDNSYVVHILNARTSRDHYIMGLVRSLLSVAAGLTSVSKPNTSPDLANPVADALSRFRWQVFRQLAPDSSATPTPLPEEILQRLAPTN
jgi:hypothetical protein